MPCLLFQNLTTQIEKINSLSIVFQFVQFVLEKIFKNVVGMVVFAAPVLQNHMFPQSNRVGKTKLRKCEVFKTQRFLWLRWWFLIFFKLFLQKVNCKTWQNIWFCDTTWGFEEHVIKQTIAVAKIIHFVNNQFGFKKLSCITTRQPLKRLLLNANVFGGGLLKLYES